MNARQLKERIGKALSVTPAGAELLRGMGGSYFAYPRSAYVDGAYTDTVNASYAHLYATQENVRTVVDYISRIAADRSLRCLRFLGDDSKQENPNHPAALTIREPNDWTGQKDMLGAFFRDKLIFDDAYLWDMGPAENGKRFLVRVPPGAMGVKSGNMLKPAGYRIRFANGSWIDLEPYEVIHWRGYSAGDARLGIPPMQTLRIMLAEASARKAQAIDQVRGGLVKGGIIERPIEAPDWSEEAMERFSESFASRLRGVVKGATPVLEEGMQFKEAGITPREAEMLSSRKFALATVAQVYGLNPALFDTSGNLDAARRAAEEDVIGPMLGSCAETFTKQLLRNIYLDDDHGFKFRAKRETDAGKLFEAGSKATGGSTLTANEFRDEFLDMPAIEGGDELVKHPGSQGGGTPPAPGSNDRGRPSEEDLADTEKAVRAAMARSDERKKDEDFRAKAGIRRRETKTNRDRFAADLAEIFRKHFRRQLRSKADLHDERWNKELTADLLKARTAFLEAEGKRISASLLGTFDIEQTRNWLRAGAKAVAEAVNKQTAIAYDEAVAAAETKADDDEDPRKKVLHNAIGERADQLGMSSATSVSSFAVHEAGKQNPGPAGTKRVKAWVWSGSANSRHGGVAGEEVELFGEFSNGMQYPGDPAGGTQETARCECALDVF